MPNNTGMTLDLWKLLNGLGTMLLSGNIAKFPTSTVWNREGQEGYREEEMFSLLFEKHVGDAHSL